MDINEILQGNKLEEILWDPEIDKVDHYILPIVRKAKLGRTNVSMITDLQRVYVLSPDISGKSVDEIQELGLLGGIAPFISNEKNLELPKSRLAYTQAWELVKDHYNIRSLGDLADFYTYAIGYIGILHKLRNKDYESAIDNLHKLDISKEDQLENMKQQINEVYHHHYEILKQPLETIKKYYDTKIMPLNKSSISFSELYTIAKAKMFLDKLLQEKLNEIIREKYSTGGAIGIDKKIIEDYNTAKKGGIAKKFLYLGMEEVKFIKEINSISLLDAIFSVKINYIPPFGIREWYNKALFYERSSNMVEDLLLQTDICNVTRGLMAENVDFLPELPSNLLLCVASVGIEAAKLKKTWWEKLLGG